MKNKMPDNLTEDTTVLNRDALLYFDRALTEKHKRILKVIYETPGISHGELANARKISATNLCNFVAKINSISPKLIIKTHTGRFKLYTFSPVGKAYIKETFFNTVPSTSNAYQDDEFYIAQAIQALSQFKAEVGNNWEQEMYDIFTSKNPLSSNAFSDSYSSFIASACELYKKEKDYLSIICDELDSSILKNLFRELIVGQFRDYTNLKPLFQLYDENADMAQDIIDKIFSENYKNYYEQTADVKFTDSFSQSQYYSIYHIVTTMVSEASAQMLTKQQVRENWYTIYKTTNGSLSYIAEKYSSLQKMRRGTQPESI